MAAKEHRVFWVRVSGGITVLAVLFAAFFAGALAQTPEEQLEQSRAEQDQLQAELAQIERQIADLQKELNSISGEKNTLQKKINQLKNQQATLNLQIKATNVQIAELEGQLTITKTTIEKSIAHIGKLRGDLGLFLRSINEQDHYPLTYLVLGSTTFSEFFSVAEDYYRVLDGLHILLGKVAEAKQQLDKQKAELETKQDDARNLLSVKTLQQQKLTSSVKQQNTILEQTKGKEANYQATLSDTQKRAAQIRSRIYELLGVGEQITFGEALQIAQWVSGQTGVRAAFLLAILTQESNLGKNVGTCNRLGDPESKSWRVIMKPSRDHAPFLAITKELGMDPDITPVSCPMRDSKGNQVGWGGAMGPAQFIPSTWMGYQERIRAVVGRTPNPWDIRDAFIASAIKLKNDGAGTPDGEWAAAMRYFSGSTDPRYRFYGDSVVSLTNQYLEDITELNN